MVNTLKTHNNSWDNNCFYCTYCQRIKVHGIHVDWYCEHHYCLTDNVKDCTDFVHVGADEQPPEDVLKMYGSFANEDSGIYIGKKYYKMYELYQMIFQMRLDINHYMRERKILANGLFDMAKKYKDYEIISQVVEELEKR